MGREVKVILPPNQLRYLRKNANLSQADVAFLLNIKNAGRVSEWENGLSMPSLEHLISLGLIFNRLPDTIYLELRKGLIKKLEVRKKLLQELKSKYPVNDEYG